MDGTAAALSTVQAMACASGTAGSIRGAQLLRTLMSAVFALKSLQNDIILRPAWPSAGPTGGAGLACPAGTMSRTTDLIAFDMLSPPHLWC